MRFASLGSGSEGNALVVALPAGGYLMVDCGFNRKEALRRLARIGLDPAGLRATVQRLCEQLGVAEH